MRKTTTFEGKRRIFDTTKAEDLGSRAYSYYGDPAGYEETLYKTKGGLYFLCGIGGTERPYADGEDIHPLTANEAEAWLND
jgi:hypothetical protein